MLGSWQVSWPDNISSKHWNYEAQCYDQSNEPCLQNKIFLYWKILWRRIDRHTQQPLWFQSRETSIFTRSERGSLPIWGFMTFLRIKNARACQGFGDRWQNFVWLSSLTSMFCRLPLITSNITLKWMASDCLLITDRAYSKNPCKRVLSE